MSLLLFLVFFSGVAFFYYGWGCFYSPYIQKEFNRYGLPQYRRLTGFLQLLGAFGLFLGLLFPSIGIIAAIGISLLMLLGFLTRIKIKDSFFQSLPSFFFMLLNGLIAFLFTSTKLTYIDLIAL